MTSLLTPAVTALLKAGLGYAIALIIGVLSIIFFVHTRREEKKLVEKIIELSQAVTTTLHHKKQTDEYIHELTNFMEKITPQLIQINTQLTVLLDRTHRND